ncbi:DUF397 domain-containing protein [Kitasatospora sp. NPDC004615]|uniref:DUF397 domain-containing protein n=1 Tax=Kitasatospora sp. NPDC004615 TaxID=3364017 RepID=UPI0036B1F526
MTEPVWFKSSYSSNGGECVEVARNLVAAEGIVPVRDSKDPEGAHLRFGPASFDAFIDAVKAGRFGNV